MTIENALKLLTPTTSPCANFLAPKILDISKWVALSRCSSERFGKRARIDFSMLPVKFQVSQILPNLETERLRSCRAIADP
jgi:hypothetical protein